MMRSLSSLFLACCILMACQPIVKVEAPNKPITINLNVKIEHEISVKVDKDLEAMFTDDSNLF